MKYKTLRFTLVSLLMMLCGTVFAGTITFGDLNLENGVQYSDPFDGGDFTVTFAGGGNDGKYYTTGAGIRVYGGGTMTVAAKSGNITSITVTYDGSNKPSNGDVVNVGTYNAETGEWTGEASSVVFTRPTGSGHWRVQSVTVTVSGGGDNPQPQTDVYTIAGTGDLTGTAEAWTIDDANKMTKNNEGLYVKTFNGITISADNQPQFKVVKNAGKDDETWYPEGDGSSNWVITPTYLGGDGIYDITITFNAETKIIGVSGVKTSWNTIAELNALQNNTAFTFFGEPLVVAKPTDKYVYIKDETGASLIYDASGEKTAAAEAGKTLAAPWTGKVSIFRSLFELVPDATLKVKDGDAVEVTYDEATTTDVTEENVNKVVIIKGLTISEINEKNITFAIGEATIAGYNQFGIELPEVTEGKTFDVVGAIGRYNDNIQFQPIKITEQVEETPEPSYYVVGTMNEWTVSDEYKMTKNTETEGVEYTFTFDAETNTELKVIDAKGTWYPGDGTGNFKLNDAGNYTIYFRPNADGGDNWYYGVIYAAKKEAPVETYTATFKTNVAWDKVYAYTWTGEGEGKVEQLGTWPGTEITETMNDEADEYDIYTVTISAEAAPEFIIFNNGNENGVEGKTKTADLAFENGKAYELMITVSELMQEAIDLAADDEAVAVGKLLEAIDWAYDNDDESQLQAAIDQFKADNADQEKDETAKVATNGWKNFNGGNAGVCATQFAPAITTYDGRNAQLAEVYEEGTAEGTAVNRIGTIIYQDITGLTNGKYKVGFYGNAFFTPGRAGMTSDMEDGATDVAYVFANDQKEFITARIATSTTENNFRQFDVEVTDGTIKLGMGKEKPGTNWHTMQIYQLTWFTTAKEVFAADQTELKALITEAKALLADESKTNDREMFEMLVNAAEEYVDSKMINTTELESVIGNLKTAIADFKKANWFIDLAAGEYYIIDAESGKMMAAGHDYGTRGIVNEIGLDLTLTPYTESHTVTIDSRVYNGDSKHFLGSNLYMDSSEWGWALEYQGFGFYILEPDGGKYINIDDNDNLVLSDTPREWIIVTKDGVKAQRLNEMSEATAENPVDATFLIQGANFNRGDARNNAWIVSDDCNNKNLSGGAQTNMCAESYHSTFTIMQTISGAPAGLYKMTAQGFYRNDEGEVAAPQFFANGVNKDVPLRTGSENSMSDASASFTAGNYTIEPIDFVVTKEGDDAGKIYVGITNQNNTQWVIWDNFQLTYYGPAPATTYTVTVAETQNGTVEVDKTEAAENETVSVTVTPADGYMVDEAYWTYGEGENETKTQIGEPAEGNTATFTMPAANVTVTVTFKAVAAEIEKFYIMGTGTANEWNGTTEMAYNEEAQAFEYTINSESGAWIAFGDVEFTNWDDFNANHRYAIGNGDVNVTTFGEAMQLLKVNGTLVLPAGKFNISVTKELLCTITEVVAPATHTWDFTKWSEATVTNLKADAAASKLEGWSDVEKKADAEAGADPTEASKDNCFWAVATPDENGELSANGVLIEELKGLAFNSTYSTARSLAIAVNYPSTSLGDYAGPAYLWLGGGGKNVDCFVIKNVKAGTAIKMGVETHKIGDARGVQLFIEGAEGARGDKLVAPDGSEVAAPTAYTEQTWAVPGEEGVCNIIVYNTKGCHIYFIDAEIGEPVEPETIETMYIVGELTGGWPDVEANDWSMAKAMTQDPENEAVWTLTVEGFEAEAKTYEYKATANGKWGVYELPGAGANNNFVFGTDEYPAGKYDLTFTVNTTDNTLTLVATKHIEDGITMLKAAIENGNVYNMNGQKVNKAQKGLYIINGRKVVIK